MIDQLAERVRRLETAESPVIYKYADDNVSDPPTQAEANTAFGGTAAQWRDGWAGIIDDAGAGTDVWLAVSKNDTWHFAKIDTGGGGVIPHDLLSISHPDTSPAAVVRGDLITGQGVVPLWTRLAHPINPNQILTCDANDVLWSGWALIGTPGQTYTLSATGGTVPTGGGVSNQVTYWATASTLGGRTSFTDDGTTMAITRNSATALVVETALGVDALTVDTVNTYTGLCTSVPQKVLHVSSPGGAGQRATIRLSDTAAATDTQVLGWLEFYRGNNTKRVGFFGFGSSTTLDFSVWNEVGGMEFGTNQTFAAGRIQNMYIDPNGLVGINTGLAPATRFHVIHTTTTTNAVLEVARIEARVSTAGTGFAAGGGPGIAFYSESATDTDYRHAGDYQLQWKVATDVGRQSQVRIWAEYDGTSCPVGVIVAPASAPTVPAFGVWGNGSVDFQTYRDNAAQVASGAFSTISGGSRQTGSGTYNAIVGGDSNTLAGDYGVTGGLSNASDSNYVAMFGRSNGIYADYGFTVGYYAQVMSIVGQRAYASGRIASAGDNQDSDVHIGRLIASHTDTTWYTLFTDLSSGLITIPADGVFGFTARIVGITSGAPEVWDYKIEGTIKNDGGTTTLLVTATTSIYEDDIAYDAQAVADDANDALLIQVRRNGGADKNINWSGYVKLVEATYA